MAKTDWALAVGITNYPAFEVLKGPEADARDFLKWVTAPDGGGVRKDFTQLIVSSGFKKSKNSIDAMPAEAEVHKFFEKLDDIAHKNDERGNGRVVGRRLYIYLSGHGFAPDDDESALLMANAAPRRMQHHIPGKAWANLFWRSGYFEEVLLFMDCCRNLLESSAMLPTFDVQKDPLAVKNGNRLFVFGTKLDAVTRERVFKKGTSRGIFTMALLEGLRGRACTPGTKLVTANSLRSYLFNNMKDFFGPRDLANPDIHKEPDIEPSQRSQDFTIVELSKVPQTGSGVRVLFPKGLKGKTVNVLDGSFNVVAKQQISGTEWTVPVPLPRGLYKAIIKGTKFSKTFEVRASGAGKGVVNVTF